MKRFLTLLLALAGFTAMAQTDKLPNSAVSSPSAFFLVNKTDTARREAWINYGSRYSDRMTRYPELLRTFVVSQQYARHYADSVAASQKSSSNARLDSLKGSVVSLTGNQTKIGQLIVNPDGSPWNPNFYGGSSTPFSVNGVISAKQLYVEQGVTVTNGSFNSLADGYYTGSPAVGGQSYFGPTNLQFADAAGNNRLQWQGNGGLFRFFNASHDGKYINLITDVNVTKNRNITMPDADGAIVLDSQLGGYSQTGSLPGQTRPNVANDSTYVTKNGDMMKGALINQQSIAVGTTGLIKGTAVMNATNILAHQGGCTDGSFWYVFDTGVIRKYSATTGALVATRNDPFTRDATMIHLGPPYLKNGILYSNVENAPAAANASTGGLQRIFAYNAADLSDNVTIDNAQFSSLNLGAALTLDEANDILYMVNYFTGTVGRFQFSTNTYIDSYTLPVNAIQGLRIVGNLLYFSCNSGIYSVNKTDGSNRTIMYATKPSDIVVEGLDYFNGALYLLEDLSNNSTTAYIYPFTTNSVPAAFNADKGGFTSMGGSAEVGGTLTVTERLNVGVTNGIGLGQVNTTSGGFGKFDAYHFGNAVHMGLGGDANRWGMYYNNPAAAYSAGGTLSDASRYEWFMGAENDNKRFVLKSSAVTGSTAETNQMTIDFATGLATFPGTVTSPLITGAAVGNSTSPVTNGQITTLSGTSVNYTNATFTGFTKLGAYGNLTASGAPAPTNGNFYWSSLNLKFYTSEWVRAVMTDDVNTAGDIVYANGTRYARLPIGANGYVLQSNGTSPAWVNVLNNTALTGNTSIVHLKGGSVAPTITAGTGAGASPTISVSGTDLSGTITLTTGSSPVAGGVIATITFNSAYATAPKKGGNPAAGNAATASLAGVQAPYYTTTTGTLILNANSTPLAANTTYVWDYTLTQ